MVETNPDEEYFLALDVEASGPSSALHFCPEFGAALVKASNGEILWRFHTYCAAPEGRTWHQKTLDEFWLSPNVRPRYDAIIAALPTAPTAGEAMKKFIAELRAVIAEKVPGGSKAVQVIFDTTGFDAAFLESMITEDCGALSLRSLCNADEDRPLRDVHSVYMGIASAMSSQHLAKNPETGKRLKPHEAACIALGIEKPTTTYEHTHNPSDDAACIAQRAAHVSRALDRKRKADSKS